MTKDKLTEAVATAKEEGREALQELYGTLNQGQRKKVLKNEKVKKWFDRFGVVYDE